MKEKQLFKLDLQTFAEDDPKQEEQKAVNPLDELTPEQVIEINKKFAKKDELDALKQKNSELISYILDGKELSENLNAETESPSISELRKQLYHSDKPLRNLDVVDKTLKLREKVMAEGQPDPFLPQGHKVVIQQADVEAANRVAESFSAAVKEANGDPDAFDNLLSKMIR